MRRSASAVFDASFFEPYGFSGSNSPLYYVRGGSGKTDWFRRRVPQNIEIFDARKFELASLSRLSPQSFSKPYTNNLSE